MAKIEIGTIAENGVFKDVDKLIELFTKAENGKPLKVKDYNLLTIIGIEKLLTYDDINRIISTVASLEEDTVANRDFIQSTKVVENLQITLIQPKSDGTKELLDMRWDYKGEKHNSAKEALDASVSKIKSYVNTLYEEVQDESLKEVKEIFINVNNALITEYNKIKDRNEYIIEDLNEVKDNKANQDAMLTQLEFHNKEQDFLIQAVIDENKKNHARVTETNVIDHSLMNDKVKTNKGQLDIHNITGNTLKNISRTEKDINVLYNIDNFKDANEFNCNNEEEILVGLKEIEGRTLFNYNNEKDIIPRIKFQDILGNTEELKNSDPGYMQIETIAGNTMTNIATIKDDTTITHQFDDLKGNHDELKGLQEGTVFIDKITGNTMTNISKSKNEFSVTHSFDHIVDGVKLPLVASKDNSHLRIGIVEGKTLENVITEEPRHMILNNREIKETFEDTITIPDTVEGGELDLIIEGHTAINLSKIKDMIPVTYKYDDIIGNEGVLNSVPGVLEIDTIKGNTLINKIISEYLEEVDINNTIHLEAHAMYQISFNIDKDCNDYTISVGKQTFNHPLTAGKNEFTLYMKDENWDGVFSFECEDNVVLDNLKIYKGGQETLILNDKIDIKEQQNASIPDTVDLGRIDIELLGNTILNLSRIKEETIVIDNEVAYIEGNIGEVNTESECIEVESIQGLTYRNLIDEHVNIGIFGSSSYSCSLNRDIEFNSEHTVFCTATKDFNLRIDDTIYEGVNNGSVIETPATIVNYTMYISPIDTDNLFIDELMLLEGRVEILPDGDFIGVMSTFESEVIEEDGEIMYQVEIETSSEGESLGTEMFLLNEPLRSVFDYNDKIIYDDKLQELVVNRVVDQIEGSVLDRNVLYSSQVGLHIDFTKKYINDVLVDSIEFTRLGDGVGRVPGRDFNHIMPWAGMRKVAIDTLTGKKTYYNEEGYAEDGSVGSIFTEVPKFYYYVEIEESENYYNNIIGNITSRNLIDWKLSYASGKLESTASNYHKSTSYYEYNKIKPIQLEYDTDKFKAEIIFFNMSSSSSYSNYDSAPDIGKFRVCFQKTDETKFTAEDIQYLIETSKVNEFRGKHINMGKWWVSNTLETGYTVHPAFIRNGEEVDYIYVASYESSAYSVSNQTFITEDDTINTNEDYLVSRRNALPMTGFGKNMTMLNNRLCANRANAHLFDFTTLSALQLLFLIEYASFDSQTTIGNGIVDLPESLSVSSSVRTGRTTSLIDKTGQDYAVAYRGIENLWGNTWTMIDGANLYNDAMTTIYWSNDELDLSITEGYNMINASSPNSKGSIRRFGYDENYPFAFIPSELTEENYINENYEQKENSGWRIFLSGGCWSSGLNAGLFSSKQDYGTSYTNLTISSRLLYY